MRIERDGVALPDLSCTNARELLAYLLLHRDRAHRREAVAHRLWGEGACPDPKKTLRQALWRLNSLLDGISAVELVGDEWIQLRPGEGLWVDVAEFEAGWREIDRLSCTDLSEKACRSARAALDLFKGDLLEGDAWEWCRFERERLWHLYLSMSDVLMDRCFATNDVAGGFRLGFEVLQIDPAREKTHRALMRLQALQGDRSAALRQYDSCVAALRRELGVEPSQRTRDLVDQIRSDRLAPPRAGSAPRGEEGMASVLERLSELRQLLSQARREVHLEIQAIESALEGRDGSGRAAPRETLSDTLER